MDTKNKITVRLNSKNYAAIIAFAAEKKCSRTKAAELLIEAAIQNPKIIKPSKSIEDCILEVATNSAAAVQELARIILADSDGEYDRYHQSVVIRTKKAILKFEQQING
jgi:hypothetical protein